MNPSDFARRIAVLFALFGAADCAIASAQDKKSSKDDPGDRETYVDGYSVSGYDENGKRIGYSPWHPTRPEAEDAKKKMEAVRITGDKKYYAKVKIDPERRRIPKATAPKQATQTPNTVNTPNDMPGKKSGGFGYDENAKKEPAKTPSKNPSSGQMDGKNSTSSSSSTSTKGSETGVSAPRDKNTGKRYESPPIEIEITLHDGRKFTFTNFEAAKEYFELINANPAWRATWREIPKSPPSGQPGMPTAVTPRTEKSGPIDVSASLLGTKWRLTRKDGGYHEYEFERRGSELWYTAGNHQAGGGQLSGGGQWGLYRAIKSETGTEVYFTGKNYNGRNEQYSLRGNEMVSKDGEYILKRR